MSTKYAWAAEKRGMERSFALITGSRTKIIDIPPEEGELGYTSADKTIHLAHEHKIMNGLNDIERKAFRKGVFCHEMLHQIFTDFSSLERKILRLAGHERRIFSMISNILEDPAIEYWAPTAVSGPLLRSLRFSIAHCYKTSPNIEESETAFGQYIAALIQFGDMGLLKGKFTFPEAKTTFFETAETFERGVKEPSASKRLDIAMEIFEASRPLWQAEADAEKAMQELAEMLSELGKSAMSGSGHGKDGDPSETGGSASRKDKRRKATIKKVSKEEMEELKKKSEGSVPGPIPEDADVTIYVCDEEDPDKKEGDDGSPTAPTPIPVPVPTPCTPDPSKEEKEGSGSSAASAGSEDGEKEAGKAEASSGDTATENDSASGEKEDKKNGEEKGGSEGEGANDTSSSSGSANEEDGKNADGDDRKKGKSGEKAGGNKETSSDSSFDAPFRPDRADASASGTSKTREDDEEDVEDDFTIDEEEYRLSEDDIAAIVSEAERNEKEVAAEEMNAEDNSYIPDYDISSAKMPHKSCLNYRMSFDEDQRDALEGAYAKTVSKMSVGIHTTTKALKRIFEDDKEEREYRGSGNISLKRLYSGTLTSQIFEKKISPADKSDLAVEILVDESGSMSSHNKYVAARECCIALAEIFNNLNIPIYIIGFTADCERHDVVHAHYITWKNTKNDRLKLLNITARYNNCDGASIRYATEVLKKKQAKNKLLIVISDGMPAASHYPNGEADTKDAIRTAKKHASVLGVAVGNSQTEDIQFLYEKDFLHVGNVEDLFSGIAKAVKKIIKTW